MLWGTGVLVVRSVMRYWAWVRAEGGSRGVFQVKRVRGRGAWDVRCRLRAGGIGEV